MVSNSSYTHPPAQKWHALTPEKIAGLLQTNTTTGLTEKDIKERRKVTGPNKFPEQEERSSFFIFLSQFKSPLIFILVIAALVTLFLKEYTDSAVISAALLLNTVIGYVQERKASRALAALKSILKKQALVIREGNEKEILQEELVPGDIIVLAAGNSVPADARIIESWDLKINEAVLTGEWISSDKKPDKRADKTQLADRENMAYMGSAIEAGSGKAIVVATGMNTEFGKIAQLVEKTKEDKTPYQQRLSKFSWILGGIVGFLAIGIFIEGIVRNHEAIEMFEVAVAIAVGAIPEGLPIAMTIVLAVGMQRILGQHGLVRKLSSAETLGSTSVIATDKTLTLTEGRMEVSQVVPFGSVTKEHTLTCASLANEAFIENPDEPFEKWRIKGRPTDMALMRAAIEAGISRKEIEEKTPRIFQIPFSSETRYIASFHQRGKKTVSAYVSGAPETILELSRLSKAKRKELLTELEHLTSQGLRVVAVAEKNIPAKEINLSKETDDPKFSEHLRQAISQLSFLGFIALKDPLRKGTKAAIHAARGAGLRTIIATGDHILTAKAVAKELGLNTKRDSVIEGKDIDEMDDEEFQRRLPNITVYARVEPQHKLRIIEAWQKRGDVIAMTGDGVNDAPALKKADIGLALGSGTEVAKEVADLVLLTDNFSIIPAAIREGRVIVDNIRKIITYLLSGSFTEIILIGISILVGTPFLPVTALQILWINLVTDSLPGIALTAEKPEKDVMRRKPERKNAPLLTPEMKTIIFAIGLFTDLLLLALFFWLLNADMLSTTHIQTIIFVGLGINSLFYIFSCRSLRQNIWEYNPFSNLFLMGSIAIGFIGLVGAVYLPLLNTLLDTTPLTIANWALLLALSFINIALIEAAKWYFIRKERRIPNR